MTRIRRHPAIAVLAVAIAAASNANADEGGAAALVGEMQGGIPGVSLDAPARDTFWACGGGTLQDADVPWVDADRVIHLDERPVVPGAVDRPSIFEMSLGSDTRRLAGNGFPDTPTGEFPVPADSAAYPYYAEAEHAPGSNVSRADVVIAAVPFDMTVPRVPEVAETPTCVDLASTGIMLNGARMVDPIEVGIFDSQAGLPLDNCFGHTSGSNGGYHHHAFSPACFDQGAPGEHSPLVGYARDGFGFFGPQGEDGAIVTNAELDECHGHSHPIDWDGETVAMFHYHLNYAFPYTVGCYRGTVVADPP